MAATFYSLAGVRHRLSRLLSEHRLSAQIRDTRLGRVGDFLVDEVQSFAGVRLLSSSAQLMACSLDEPARDCQLPLHLDLRLAAVLAVVAQLGAPRHAVLVHRPQRLTGMRFAAGRGLVSPKVASLVMLRV